MKQCRAIHKKKCPEGKVQDWEGPAIPQPRSQTQSSQKTCGADSAIETSCSEKNPNVREQEILGRGTDHRVGRGKTAGDQKKQEKR